MFPFAQDIRLENERTLLRPMDAEDLQHLMPVATQMPRIVQFSPMEIHTPELWAAWLNRTLDERKQHTRYALTIYDKQAGRYAGTSSFGSVSHYDRRVEIGWTWIGREFQGTGLNTNMKLLMLAFAFETLQYERVEFRTDERNRASRKALEKLGAQQEGILRSHMRMPDGFRRYTVYYSILHEEWPQIKAGLLERLSAENKAG